VTAPVPVVAGVAGIEPPGIEPGNGVEPTVVQRVIAAAATDPRADLVALVNGYREVGGLRPLAVSPILSRAAQAKAEAMAAAGVMAHELNGVTAKQNAVNHGYPASAYGGENILWGQATAAQAFAVWRDSPPHRANMLSTSHTAIGVGGPATADTRIRNAWAQVFGRFVDTPGPTPPPPVHPPSPPIGTVTGATPWRTIGPASLDTWRNEFTRRSSPMLSTVDACHKAAGPHSALILAILAKESEYGTTGAGSKVLNPGNVSCGWKDGGHVWCRYATWFNGILAIRERIEGNAYATAVTLADLLNIYAPPFENDTRQYVAQTAERINGYLSGGVPPMPTPVVTFGRVPRPANYQDRALPTELNTAWDDLGPRTIKAVCLHRMIGTLTGTDAYFRGDARQKARTDFGIGLGKVYQWTPLAGRVAPWANGPATDVEGDGIAFVKRYGVGAVNRDVASVEIAGNYETAVPAPDLDRIVETVAWIVDGAARVPWDRWPNNNDGLHMLLGHFEFGPKECPGSVVRALYPTIIARVRDRLKQYQGGDAPAPQPQTPTKASKVPLPSGMTLDDAAEWFGPHWDPNGSVSVLWLEEAVRTGRYPALVWFDPAGTVPRRFRFADGTVFIADKDGVRILRRVV